MKQKFLRCTKNHYRKHICAHLKVKLKQLYAYYNTTNDLAKQMRALKTKVSVTHYMDKMVANTLEVAKKKDWFII